MLDNTTQIDWYTHPTGDPFADIGGYTIQCLRERKVTEKNDIISLIEFVTDIYVRKWCGGIKCDRKWGGGFNAYFHNSAITQPVYQGEVKFTKSMEYFTNLLKDNREKKEGGLCRITGQRTELFPAGRDLFSMTGSGTFVNFHNFFEQGIMLSREAIIRSYFVPFGTGYIGEKIGLLVSSDQQITKFFAEQNCIENLGRLGKQISDGVLKLSDNKPSNAVVNFVYSWKAKNASDEERKANLTLYHFTNYGLSPEVNVIQLTNPAFGFLQIILSHRREEWNKFTMYFFIRPKTKRADMTYDEEKLMIFYIDKKEKKSAEPEEYKTWYNPVYENLLNGKSLISLFKAYVVKHSLDFDVVVIYLIKVVNMERKAIEKIKEISQVIVEGNNEDEIGRRINKLNGFKNVAQLRQYFLKLIRENYNAGKETPLITLEEYLDYLLPMNQNWREIRDLILIASYELLHKKGLKIHIDAIEEENEITGEVE